MKKGVKQKPNRKLNGAQEERIRLLGRQIDGLLATYPEAARDIYGDVPWVNEGIERGRKRRQGNQMEDADL
jgi:hypothetical protein